MSDQRAAGSGQRAGWPILLCALCAALCALACQREKRLLTPTAAESQLATTALKNPYEGNAYAISQGQQLYAQYNCVGCHFHGGGGIGPPLMDDEWIYGSSPANIYESISRGRPNGMPSFGGHIPDFQIWYLVTYVRALGGLEPRGATPVRADEMEPKK